MKLSQFVKLITPPLLVSGYCYLRSRPYSSKDGNRGKYGLSGNYQTWAEALAASTGYENEAILEKTRAALLKIKNSEAVYERDSSCSTKSNTPGRCWLGLCGWQPAVGARSTC
jgi:hypothetical protein